MHATQIAEIKLNERIAAIREAYRKDMEAGARDAKAGFYDKWYRHNRVDDGAAYEAGWMANKDESKDYQIIEA